jgi:hypothetical protein
MILKAIFVKTLCFCNVAVLYPTLDAAAANLLVSMFLCSYCQLTLMLKHKRTDENGVASKVLVFIL